jgi:hypothetical protein
LPQNGPRSNLLVWRVLLVKGSTREMREGGNKEDSR